MNIVVFDRELNSMEAATLGKCLTGRTFKFMFCGATSWSPQDYLATCREWLNPRSEDFVLLPARTPVREDLILPAITEGFRHLIPYTQDPERGLGGPRYNDYLWELVEDGRRTRPNRPFPTITISRYVADTEGRRATSEWLDHEP